MEGTIIARKYRVLEKVGKGQFGSVSRGICLNNAQKYVAIKMEQDEVNLLKHEATVLHYLDSQKCKNIPTLYYYGFQKPAAIVCIVMSFYSQGSLDIWRPNMDTEEKMHWWNTALDILEHIHKAGIVHRDLKPHHFMRDEHHEWHLIDFGLATSYLDDNHDHIKEVPKDQIIGSPNYVSWFVHCGRDVVRRDDFLSLVYIFWELLYGSYLSTSEEAIENKYSVDVLDEFNAWLKDQKEFGRFFRLLETKPTKNDEYISFMVSLLSHAEKLKFRDKPKYELFYHLSYA